MPSLAKAYIAMIAALATAALVVVAARWNPQSLGRFVLFFALAMVASAMKIRLPGFKTTISINFVFILIGIALFSFGETDPVSVEDAAETEAGASALQCGLSDGLYGRGILDFTRCSFDAGIKFIGCDDGAGSLRVRSAEHRARLPGHFLRRATIPKTGLALLL